MSKNFLYRIHSFAGLISGVFILLMSLSGALLVFHEEIDRMQFPAIHNPANKPILTIDSAYRLLQIQFPKAQISSCLLPEDKQSPYIFSLYDSSYRNGEQSLQVFLHPVTGEFLWQRGGTKDIRNNFMAWLTAFHNSFHLKKKGEWLLGVLGVIFLISLLSGIFLYRKNIWAVICFQRAVFRRQNLHQLIGVWALLFNLVIGITGVWMQRYVFKKDFYGPAFSYTRTIHTSPALFFSFDSALQNLHQVHPAFTPYVIYFSGSKQGSTALYGSRSTNSFIHSRKYADAVFLDSTGSIKKTAFVTDIVPENRRDIINAQIHYGRYGGWGVKIFYAIFGLSGALLSITGFALWIRKRKQFN